MIPGGIWRRHPDSNRGIRVLQTLALPLGYAAIHMSVNGLAVRPHFAGYSAGYRSQTHHLGPDHRIRDAAVTLGRRDRRVPQQVLKGGETTSPVHPRASECVPQHVHMKPLHVEGEG